MSKRKIIETITGKHAIDGAGVHLVRVVGYHDVRRYDPFLLLDAFDSHNSDDYTKGFPWHPHRGIETVTYLIKGKINHEDSLGNKGAIDEGECQWMTAGSGILHQEMPQASEHMQGLQLWINLPRKDKMTQPKYCDIRADMVNTVTEDNATIKIISGNYKGVQGVQGQHVDALMLDIDIKPNNNFSLTTNKDDNLFIYIITGEGKFDETSKIIPYKTAVLFDKSEEFHATAGASGVRFILFAGKQLNEPIAWGGPIVMNTAEELDQAFNELEDNTFIK